eukprot:9826923-Karenia_brevis.AAC.1
MNIDEGDHGNSFNAGLETVKALTGVKDLLTQSLGGGATGGLHADAPEYFPVGGRVEIFGLQSRTELN